MNVVERYESVKPLIFKVVKEFQRRHGGEWDELLGEANLLFMKSLEGYDWRKGKFSKRIAYKVWWGLFSQRSQQMTREGRMGERDTSLPLEDVPCEDSFDLVMLTEEVSDDAALLIELALQEDGKGTPDRKRGRLAAILIDLGWTATRILESFQEIREALFTRD